MLWRIEEIHSNFLPCGCKKQQHQFVMKIKDIQVWEWDKIFKTNPNFFLPCSYLWLCVEQRLSCVTILRPPSVNVQMFRSWLLQEWYPNKRHSIVNSSWRYRVFKSVICCLRYLSVYHTKCHLSLGTTYKEILQNGTCTKSSWGLVCSHKR